MQKIKYTYMCSMLKVMGPLALLKSYHTLTDNPSYIFWNVFVCFALFTHQPQNVINLTTTHSWHTHFRHTHLLYTGMIVLVRVAQAQKFSC